jgi:Methyltransferase domain
MTSLDTIALRHGTDKASNCHGFTAIYEPLFAPFRFEPITLLEIGVLAGASVRTWGEYFPAATIIGIDIRPSALAHESDRVSILIGDQADREFLLTAAERGPFQIIIDDGAHMPEEQITSLLTLWPYVAPGGIYAVEDIHTSYLELEDGKWHRLGRLGEGTMVERLKDIIDDVNQKWHDQPVALEALASVHVHPELAVFIKKRAAMS